LLLLLPRLLGGRSLLLKDLRASAVALKGGLEWVDDVHLVIYRHVRSRRPARYNRLSVSKGRRIRARPHIREKRRVIDRLRGAGHVAGTAKPAKQTASGRKTNRSCNVAPHVRIRLAARQSQLEPQCRRGSWRRGCENRCALAGHKAGRACWPKACASGGLTGCGRLANGCQAAQGAGIVD
jgi:hypothetical protein